MLTFASTSEVNVYQTNMSTRKCDKWYDFHLVNKVKLMLTIVFESGVSVTIPIDYKVTEIVAMP